jgi:acyl-CoA oxidase
MLFVSGYVTDRKKRICPISASSFAVAMEIQQQQQQQQQRRVRTILKHIIFSSSLNYVTLITSSVCTHNKHDFLLDPKLFSDIIDYDMQEYRQQLYEFLKDPIFIPRYDLSMQEYRELTLQRLKKVLDAKLISINDYKNNLRKYLAFHDVMRMTDLSLAVKLGVHMTLFGGTILNLGTEYHHKKWLPGIDTFEYAGCFGMTELGNYARI